MEFIPIVCCMFQHSAARRRLAWVNRLAFVRFVVSTLSRPKAAAGCVIFNFLRVYVSTLSRPKAAGHHHRQARELW